MKIQKKPEYNSQEPITKLLDSETILVISKSDDDEYPLVSVKYMEGKETRETIIARQTPGTHIEYNDRMIAVFTPSNKLFRKRKLVSVYDVKRHDFGSSDLLTLNYSVLSYEGSQVKQLGKK